MKGIYCLLACTAIVAMMLVGCTPSESTGPDQETSVVTGVQDETVTKTTTTAVPLYEDVPSVNLIWNDHELLSVDFIKSYLSQLKEEQAEIQFFAYADMVTEKCEVTDAFLEILKLDEWKEADIDLHRDDFFHQIQYRHRVNIDNEEMLFLCIGEEYATIEVKVMVPFCYENGTQGKTPQIQGIRVWELPQDESGDVMRKLVAYGEALPSF